VALSDSRQGHSGTAIFDDLLPIDVQPRPPDLTPFEPRTMHSRPNALDDQISLQLANGGNNYDQGATERRVCIDILAEADESDIQAVELVQHVKSPSGPSGRKPRPIPH